MLHLKRYGLVYYLSLPEKEIEKRLYNITSRGIAMRRGETIEEVFACRRALYEEYGDIKVECGGKSMEEIVAPRRGAAGVTKPPCARVRSCTHKEQRKAYAGIFRKQLWKRSFPQSGKRSFHGKIARTLRSGKFKIK